MKFQNGAVTLYAVPRHVTPKTPTELHVLAEKHGVPVKVCPEYAGDRAIVGRVFGAMQGKVERAGWQIKRLETDHPQTIVYSIAGIYKDTERERTDYQHEDAVRWDGTGMNGDHIEGTHEVARQLDGAYQQMRGLVCATDWTKRIIDYIVGDCGAMAINPRGAWWVPPAEVPKLLALRAMLAEVGIALIVCEVEPANVGDMREVATSGLHDQLEALREEVRGFDGTQKASVYKTRLEQLRAVRAKALAYEQAVGLKAQEFQAVLDAIDLEVRKHLTVRLETTIKKDGTQEAKGGPTLAEQVAYVQQLAAADDRTRAAAFVAGTLTLDLSTAQALELGAAPDGDPGERHGADGGLADLLREASGADEPDLADLPDTF